MLRIDLPIDLSLTFIYFSGKKYKILDVYTTVAIAIIILAYLDYLGKVLSFLSIYSKTRTLLKKYANSCPTKNAP